MDVSGSYSLVYELQELDDILTQEWATCSDVKSHGLDKWQLKGTTKSSCLAIYQP